jgi:hypothetical protein
VLPDLVVPLPTPARHVPGYQMPETADRLLTWDFVAERMMLAREYWLSSTYADGRPHTVPVWGLWHHDRIHLDGSPHTVWSTHLRRDPRAAVHPPDAQRVVIVHGTARMLEDDELSDADWSVLDGRFQAKYDVEEGSPYWVVEPTSVLAWDGDDLTTMTRWAF